MKKEKRYQCIMGLIIAILIIVMAQSVSAGDGVTRYWGVFVGIADYHAVTDLNFCADDATSIYNLFLQDSRWNESRMTLLRNSQASRMAIENAITAMASSSDDDDICLFFFSGHGGQADVDFVPSDELDGSDEYLVCWDSNNSDYSGDFIDDDMGETLGQISGTTVVMLDACFSGGHIKATSSKGASGKNQTSRNVKFIVKPFEQHSWKNTKWDGFASDLVDRASALKDANDQSDIIILTSSDDDETSLEEFEFRHGSFTYFLLLGLKSNDVDNNGSVSAEESFAYLEPALRKYTNSTVTPQIYDDTSGEIDLLNPTAERLVFVGSGDFTWIYPFNTYYLKRRAEYIYTQSQLGPEGHIQALKIFVAETPLMPLENCTIRIKHTTDSEYSSSPQWTSSGWTTVYSGTKTIDDIGPVPFILSTPFHYDGIRNLIIDFSFSNSSYENEGLFYGSFSDKYSMIYHSSDNSAYGIPTTWAGTWPQPTRDENPPDPGSYLDLELELDTINITLTKPVYFPHIASNSTWETEICVINTSSEQSLSGNLKAYNDSGQEVSSTPIILAANARREIVVGDELPNPGGIGYIIFESDSESVCGYTKFYIEGKNRVAFPAISDVNSGDIYISHIASNEDWWTGVSILNTTSSSKELTVEFDNGTTKPITIAAKEHQKFTINSLFGGVLQPNINSAVIKNGSGIVGLELFGSSDSSGDNYLSGILLKDETKTHIYYPHFASNSTWWTGIVAYNPSISSSNLTITPFSDDGTSLTPQTISLAGKEKYIGTAQSLNSPAGTAWYRIVASSPITGFELFGTHDGNQLGGYTGVGISGTDGVFAKTEKDGWTGIAFVNIENAPATVTMTAYNDSGNVIATNALNINAYEKVVEMAPNLFYQDISNATYISYSSGGEIVGFQLNGSSDNMMLDALPGM